MLNFPIWLLDGSVLPFASPPVFESASPVLIGLVVLLATTVAGLFASGDWSWPPANKPIHPAARSRTHLSIAS